MSDSDISTSTRSSRSRTSTSRSRTGSSTSTFRSSASNTNLETETFVLTNTPTATGLVTATVPLQTESTPSSLASPSSTPTSNQSDNSGSNPPVAVIAVSTILGVLVIGIAAFLLIFRRRRRRTGKSPYITRHEPKRRDTHPQPTIQESSLYLASKEPEHEKDSAPMSPSSSSLDSDMMRSPKSKIRSSRASSSIFIDDRDDVTISSRSNYFRPLSLGSQTAQSAATTTTTQPAPLFDRLNSNRVDSDHRQLPTIPGTPATPRFAFFTPEEQDGEALIAQAQPTQEIPLSRTTTRNSNRSSRSSRSKTRNSTPPTPTSSLPPLSPPPPIPLPPLPLPSASDDHPSSKRVSTNTLAAPSRPGLGDSRPVSMQSTYSVQSQNLSPAYSGALSPDVLATLERLKKRVSTPWSINSVDTYGFNRTAAPTEEGHS